MVMSYKQNGPYSGLLFLYNYVIHTPHIFMKQAHCQSKLHFKFFQWKIQNQDVITCTTVANKWTLKSSVSYGPLAKGTSKIVNKYPMVCNHFSQTLHIWNFRWSLNRYHVWASHFARISISHFAHGLIKLWHNNHCSFSRKTIIFWNTNTLILHTHGIRSWNTTSCYLANLDGSSNKQPKVYYRLFQSARIIAYKLVYIVASRCRYASWEWKYALWQHYSLHIAVSNITRVSLLTRVSPPFYFQNFHNNYI